MIFSHVIICNPCCSILHYRNRASVIYDGNSYPLSRVVEMSFGLCAGLLSHSGDCGFFTAHWTGLGAVRGTPVGWGFASVGDWGSLTLVSCLLCSLGGRESLTRSRVHRHAVPRDALSTAC